MNFNETENRLEAKLKRELRSEILIAQFQYGFAAGWRMAVLDSFREALDIRLLSRMKAGKEVLVWTQGPFFNFKQGDTIYDSPKAYESWDDPTDAFSLMIQVVSAQPVGYDDPEITQISAPNITLVQKKKTKKGKEITVEKVQIEDYQLAPGHVKFKALQKTRSGPPAFNRQEFECTQNDFVVLLQSGILNRRGKPQLDLFQPWEVNEPQNEKKENTPSLPGF